MSSQAVFMRISVQRGLVLFLAALICLLHVNAAIAQQTGSANRDQGTQALAAKPDRSSASSRDTRRKPDLWFPGDIDQGIQPVAPGEACPLSDVLLEAGKRLQELVRNVDKFTATEVVEHQSVDRSGRLRPPEVRKFNYLVSIAQDSRGHMNVEEYRNGGSTDQFPEHMPRWGYQVSS